MRNISLLASITALSLGLSPASAFAASSTSDVSEDDVLTILEDSTVKVDCVGGGGGDSMYYPGPGGGGISIDATVTTEVTPDFVAVNGYCEVTDLESRAEVRTKLTNIYNAIKADVGADGRVRKSGSAGIYPYYDPYGGGTSNHFSGSINVMIRVVRVDAAQKISDILDENGCTPNWDVRLTDSQDVELNALDSLLAKINKRKKIYEKLIGKRLTKVTGASLYTWVDGYSTYDPETNKADATTTLTLTFDIGSVRVQGNAVPMTKPAIMPKG